tara:strand:+ start:738 stop:1127 length:390 start_codon:yes stop_codon:yes gene_type:complete
MTKSNKDLGKKLKNLNRFMPKFDMSKIDMSEVDASKLNLNTDNIKSTLHKVLDVLTKVSSFDFGNEDSIKEAEELLKVVKEDCDKMDEEIQYSVDEIKIKEEKEKEKKSKEDKEDINQKSDKEDLDIKK